MSNPNYSDANDASDFDINALVLSFQQDDEKNQKSDIDELREQLLIEDSVSETLSLLANHIEGVSAYRALLDDTARSRSTTDAAAASAFDVHIHMITEFMGSDYDTARRRAEDPTISAAEILLGQIMNPGRDEEVKASKIAIAQNATEVFGHDISRPLRLTMDQMSFDDVAVAELSEEDLMGYPLSERTERFVQDMSRFLKADVLCGKLVLDALTEQAGARDDIEEHAMTLIHIAVQRVQGKDYLAKPFMSKLREIKAVTLQAAYRDKQAVLKKIIDDVCKLFVYEAPQLVTEAEVLWPTINLGADSSELR